MFKKQFKVSAYNSIAGKDKKKLKKDVQKIFNSEVVEQIFNDEINEKIFQNKLQSSKVIVYSNEKYPIFIDATSKGDYFPSLYLVFAYPDLIEGIEINPGVESFIAKGANLMWPGVKSPENLGEFKKDDVRYIVDSNENIIGLGALGSSSSEIKEGEAKQGIALYILHTIGDKLWEFGPKSIPPIILPPKIQKLGFTKPQEVVSLAKEEEVEQPEEKKEEKKVEVVKKKTKAKKKKQKESDEEEDDEDDNFEGLLQFASKSNQLQSSAAESKKDNALDQLLKSKKEIQDIKEEISGKKIKGKGKKEKEKEKEKEEIEDKFSDEDKPKKGSKGKKKGGKKEEEEETKTGEIPTKIMDEYIFESFMNALKVSLSDKDLPIDSSVFYSSHMLQCKREGIMIDLKFSTYKKIGKFFQVMSKQGFIEYKEAKKGTSPLIMKVNRGVDKLEKWEPTISRSQKKNDDVSEEKKTSSSEEVFKLQITELFKPKKDNFIKLFNQDKEYYTREEVRNQVLLYIKNNSELCQIEKSQIILDPYLISQLQIVQDNEEEEEKEKEEEVEVEQKTQEENQEPTKKKKHNKQVAKVLKEELFEKVEKSMLVYHKIQNISTKREDIKAGAFKGIQLTTEKAHNKNITRIIGLETYGFNIQNLSNKFQIKFATAVSLHDLPGKVSPGKEMVVQGNALQDLIDYFTQECLIDKKYININDKLAKKQKKN